MPWGVAAAVGASAVGAGVSAALAPGTSTGSSQQFIPSGLGSADSTWQNLLSSEQSIYDQGNPYSQGYQSAANTAGTQYGQLANTVGGYATQLGQQATANYGSQAALQAAGQQVFNQATDPNQAQYNLSLSNLNSQTNAQQALRGLGNSAVGASEIANTDANFGINWNTQQIQNSIAGEGALASAYNTAGSYGQLGNADLQGASQLGALQPQYQLAAGSTPYNAANTIQNNQLSQAAGIQGQIIPYLNGGIGATGNAFNAANQQAQSAGSSAATGIGSAAQGLASYFNNGGTPVTTGTTDAASTPQYNAGSLGIGGLGSSAQNYYSGLGNSNAYGFTM